MPKTRTLQVAATRAPKVEPMTPIRASVIAEGSLPDSPHPGYVKIPLSPAVKRQVGLAVLDQRQASPAALAFIELASRLNPQ